MFTGKAIRILGRGYAVRWALEYATKAKILQNTVRAIFANIQRFVNGGAMKLYVPEIPEPVLMDTDDGPNGASEQVRYSTDSPNFFIDEFFVEQRHWTEKQRYDYYNMLRGRLAPTISTF